MKKTKTHRHRQQFGDDQREKWKRERYVRVGNRGSNIYGDRRRFDVGW